MRKMRYDKGESYFKCKCKPTNACLHGHSSLFLTQEAFCIKQENFHPTSKLKASTEEVFFI